MPAKTKYKRLGNPAIMMLAAQNKDSITKIVDTGIKVAVVGGGLYFGHRYYVKWRAEQAEKKYGATPEGSQAVGLKAAMNPSGFSWFKSVDTTNVSAVMEIAARVKNYSMVQDIYKKIYDSSLEQDLQSELSAEDYAKFKNIVTATNRETTTVNTGKVGAKVVITIADANLRKTPVLDNKNIISFSPDFTDNIITKAKANTYIGRATGTQTLDKINNVWFIEVVLPFKGDKPKMAIDSEVTGKKVFWVAQSQVQLRDITSIVPDSIPYINIKPSAFSGFAGSEFPAVVTFKPTEVFSENFKPVTTVGYGIVLGEKIAELSHKNGLSYIMVKMPEGFKIWVNKQTVVLR